MKSGQGFLLVFSITSSSSLRELAEIRDQLVRIKNDSKVPLVLVGNKADLEENRVVSHQRAVATAQSWGNKPYFETSAKRRNNVDEVFVDLCRQIMRKDAEASRAADERPGQGSGQRQSRQRHDDGRQDGRQDGRRRRRGRDREHRCTIL